MSSITINGTFIAKLYGLTEEIRRLKELGQDFYHSEISRLTAKRNALLKEVIPSINRRPIGQPVSSSNLEDNIVRFVYSKDSKLRLKDVPNGSFFVDSDNRLCQKSYDDCDEVWIVSDEEGIPYGQYERNFGCDTIIKKIIPQLERIEY